MNIISVVGACPIFMKIAPCKIIPDRQRRIAGGVHGAWNTLPYVSVEYRKAHYPV